MIEYSPMEEADVEEEIGYDEDAWAHGEDSTPLDPDVVQDIIRQINGFSPKDPENEFRS